jgi:hypothetical protein
VVNGGEDILQVHLQGSSPLGVSWRFQMRCARKLMVGMRYWVALSDEVRQETNGGRALLSVPEPTLLYMPRIPWCGES